MNTLHIKYSTTVVIFCQLVAVSILVNVGYQDRLPNTSPPRFQIEDFRKWYPDSIEIVKPLYSLESGSYVNIELSQSDYLLLMVSGFGCHTCPLIYSTLIDLQEELLSHDLNVNLVTVWLTPTIPHGIFSIRKLGFDKNIYFTTDGNELHDNYTFLLPYVLLMNSSGQILLKGSPFQSDELFQEYVESILAYHNSNGDN